MKEDGGRGKAVIPECLYRESTMVTLDSRFCGNDSHGSSVNLLI